MEPLPEAERRQALISFLTTEHFTLQGARTGAVAEINSRMQIYMALVSMSVLGLALAAQVSSLGDPFFAFAFILLPVAYVFGLATGARLQQCWAEWFVAGQGMARIRRFFVDSAPETERYLTLPTSDEPMATLRAIGIRPGGPLRGFVTAYAVVAMVNSIVFGAFAGLLTIRVSHRGLPSALVGAAAFVVSLMALMTSGRRNFQGQIAAAEVRFPVEPAP